MTPIEKIVQAKSIGAAIFPNGTRIDSIQARYPRIIHGEVMTHRVFSRNAGSSRAIPTLTVLKRDEMYVPRFKVNQPGMQPGDYLDPHSQDIAERLWIEAAEFCRETARALAAKNGPNVHKQWASRMTEWFSWIDVIITSTQWTNFDALRIHPAAQDEVELLARAINDARDEAMPVQLKPGDWHLPYVTEQDRSHVNKLWRAPLGRDAVQVLETLKVPDLKGVFGPDKLLLAMSAARSCRVSYGKHDGEPSSFEEDMKRFLGLAHDRPLHGSPMEHQARGLEPGDDLRLQGNLLGAVQFRKCLPGECQ